MILLIAIIVLLGLLFWFCAALPRRKLCHSYRRSEAA